MQRFRLSIRLLSKLMVMVLFLTVMLGCSGSGGTGGTSSEARVVLTTPRFDDGGEIPPVHTCKGRSISPPLSVTESPEGTKSIAIILEDPDAPGGTFVHWLIWNIPAEKPVLKPKLRRRAKLPKHNNIRQGRNSFGEVGYGAPCPPEGSTHRYVFTAYALDSKLGLRGGANKGQLTQAMEGHILGTGQLTGRFGR